MYHKEPGNGFPGKGETTPPVSPFFIGAPGRAHSPGTAHSPGSEWLPDEDCFSLMATIPIDRAVGIISLSELLKHKNDELLDDVMIRNVVAVQTDTDAHYAAVLLRNRGYRALPVVDYEGKLVDVVGGTLPFIIKRLGKDPAMMTGPVLTTITDITGVTIYLGLSALFLTKILGV